MRRLDTTVRSEFLSGLATVAPSVRRAVVLVHVPKTAGSAFLRTAELAGWNLLELEQLLRQRGRCDQCSGSCDAGVRWDPSAVDGTAPGLLVSVGHHPVDVGLEAAEVLRAGGLDVRTMLAVRDPVARLSSLFRFYWRNAIAGGVDRVVHAAGAGRRRRWAIGLARLVGGTRLRRRLGTDHRRRTDRGFALNGLHYATSGRDGLVIDGRRWLDALVTYGPGVPFWLDEFVGTPDRLSRLRDADLVEVIPTWGLDAVSERILGRPAVRANVTSDAPHPAVVAALAAMGPDLARVAARDDAFRGAIEAAQP